MHIYWIEATKSGAKYGENLVQNVVKTWCKKWRKYLTALKEKICLKF